ncbi:signal /GGDEF domain protein, partial [Vibrio parahaemolyticus V-223/04]
TAMRTR